MDENTLKHMEDRAAKARALFKKINEAMEAYSALLEINSKPNEVAYLDAALRVRLDHQNDAAVITSKVFDLPSPEIAKRLLPLIADKLLERIAEMEKEFEQL